MKTLLVLLFVAIASVCIAADYQAEVVSPKKLVGFGYEAVVHSYHAACGGGWTYEDVTTADGIRDPNLFVVKITCDNATIAKMKDDGYIILWTQRMPDKSELGQATEPVKPLPKQTKAELDKLLYDLRYVGFPETAVVQTAMSDTAKADVTAADVSVQLKSLMKEFPAKAKTEAGETIKP